jgi:hypothetical protein
MILGAAAPSAASSSKLAVVQAVALVAQTLFTQPQVGTTAGQKTEVHTGFAGVAAVFAMHMPQQPAAPRNSQSASTLQAFGLGALQTPWYATVTFTQEAAHELL